MPGKPLLGRWRADGAPAEPREPAWALEAPPGEQEPEVWAGPEASGRSWRLGRWGLRKQGRWRAAEGPAGSAQPPAWGSDTDTSSCSSKDAEAEDDISTSGGSVSSGGGGAAAARRRWRARRHEPAGGVYGVDYSKYRVDLYVRLPAPLALLCSLPGLRNYLVVAKPTMDKSAGLEGYRSVVPRRMRRAAPLMVVVDEPGLADHRDKGYTWFEFRLADVFKLDVRGMACWGDYLGALSRKARWNCRDRQKKLEASPLVVEYGPLTPEPGLIAALLPLYKATGERNGHCVLSDAEFEAFHAHTPGLTLMTIRDSSQGGRLVTFCTGVRSGDVLMPLWCGTDYDHELAARCSTYYNMLYEYFKVAIADPTISWVDLGATRRQAKTAIGCRAYPVSGYVRCKNALMSAVVEAMMKGFNPGAVMNDP